MKFSILFISMLIAVSVSANTPIDSVKNILVSPLLKYSKFEIGIASMQLQPQNQLNPYDSSHVNMWAIFTSPSGKKYRRNGFFFQPYERHFERPNNIVIPGGNCSIGWNDVAEYEYPDQNAFMVPINTISF